MSSGILLVVPVVTSSDAGDSTPHSLESRVLEVERQVQVFVTLAHFSDSYGTPVPSWLTPLQRSIGVWTFKRAKVTGRYKL